MTKKKARVKNNCLYFDISKQERDSAIRYILGMIIKARSKNNFPSNHLGFDEDVNVYMAHLLFAVSLPEYHDMAEPYLSLDSSDILKWVRATEDRILRYFIFKVNADHILMHTAIFNDLLETKQPSIVKKSEGHYLELARLYYDQAAAYHKRIYKGKTGVAEVLQKLSTNFEPYQNLLQTVRRDYMQFINSFKDQAFNHFQIEINSYESQHKKKELMDLFLELYARWMETKDEKIKNRIYGLSDEIKALDPEFKFDPKKQLENSGGWDNGYKCA